MPVFDTMTAVRHPTLSGRIDVLKRVQRLKGVAVLQLSTYTVYLPLSKSIDSLLSTFCLLFYSLPYCTSYLTFCICIYQRS